MPKPEEERDGVLKNRIQKWRKKYTAIDRRDMKRNKRNRDRDLRKEQDERKGR